MTGSHERRIAEISAWLESGRFKGIVRLHSARMVMEQQGTIDVDYTVARDAAVGFYAPIKEFGVGFGLLRSLAP